MCESLDWYPGYDVFGCWCLSIGGFVNSFCGLQDELVPVIGVVVIRGKESSSRSE